MDAVADCAHAEPQNRQNETRRNSTTLALRIIAESPQTLQVRTLDPKSECVARAKADRLGTRIAGGCHKSPHQTARVLLLRVLLCAPITPKICFIKNKPVQMKVQSPVHRANVFFLSGFTFFVNS
jgi:hypothetical protein